MSSKKGKNKIENEKAELITKKMKVNFLNVNDKKAKMAYIITKSDDNKITFYTKKEEVIDLLHKKIEFSIVKDSKLKKLNLSKKHVFISIIKDKIIVYFSDNDIIEINFEVKSGEKNMDEIKIEYEDPYIIILKKLILLYAFEQDFPHLISKNIEDGYDMKNYYLINKSIIEKFKKIIIIKILAIYCNHHIIIVIKDLLRI